MNEISAPSHSQVWVTGATGLIGSLVVQMSARFAAGWIVCPRTRRQFDLADPRSVAECFHQEHPSAIIHCGAVSRPVDCERDPGLARRINVDGTRVLAELATDIPLIFLSSDMVFDGRKGGYSETDAVNPMSVYAETKIEGEQLILKNPRHTVVRTSLNYGASPTGNRSFNEEMMTAWQAGKTLSFFTDEFRCPIPAVVTARVLWELLNQRAKGLYHVAGSERLSRWDIAECVVRRHPGIIAPRMAVSRIAYQGPPRPADTSLNCSRVQSLLPFPLPSFSEWMANDS